MSKNCGKDAFRGDLVQIHVELRRGDPKGNIHGKVIVIPDRVEQIRVEELDLNKIRESYVKHAIESMGVSQPTETDVVFLAEDSRSSTEFVRKVLNSLNV
jgi:hypothetical protein